jgi:probable F420-dependent oxidoreductase
VKFGAIFPTTEIGSDPVAIRDWAQAAEALGYDHVIAYDHVLGAEHRGRTPPLAGPYTERDAFHEPLTLFAYLAGVTRRLELVTGVLILPQRQTALVAKQAAEVDLLSGGRLRLGVGSGWNHVEYAGLGVPWSGRGARLEEQVELLRRLWREPVLDYTGRFHRVERAGILPLPGRSIPIWYGAFAPVALARAARTGDGLYFGAAPSRVRRLWEGVVVSLREAGRAVADFGSEASVDFSADSDGWAKELEIWREAGGTHLSLRAMDTAAEQVGARRVGYRGPQDYIDALRRFCSALGFGR